MITERQVIKLAIKSADIIKMRVPVEDSVAFQIEATKDMTREQKDLFYMVIEELVRK